ncbi:MAG: hypothetical protein DMD83_21190 [Candidatus Rokuibacteriota bacterium]|nr:MAG: hypothetical protein DMD83_21190 [Candidatus Rokubacteria bacterium]
MKEIPYWIQRADFSATDYDPVEATDAVRAFATHDWRRELDLYSELERAGAECCPPGIGFVDPSGDILHICPSENGHALVHYHFTARRKFLGLIPVARSLVETRRDVHRSVVSELISLFFQGQHDWMLAKLGAP